MARSVDDLQLVAVGPLTNIALALRRDPSLPSRLGGFTIMGGGAHIGNVTAVAEFNVGRPRGCGDRVPRVPDDHDGRARRHPSSPDGRDRPRSHASSRRPGCHPRRRPSRLRRCPCRRDRRAQRRADPRRHCRDVSRGARTLHRRRASRRGRTLGHDHSRHDRRRRPAGRAGGRGPAPANARVLLDADEQAVIDGIVDAIIALDAS